MKTQVSVPQVTSHMKTLVYIFWRHYHEIILNVIPIVEVTVGRRQTQLLARDSIAH
jgi:hypothetical protein